MNITWPVTAVLQILSTRCPQCVPNNIQCFCICVLTFRPLLLDLLLLLVRSFLLSSQQLSLPLQALPLMLVFAGFPAGRSVTGVHLWCAPALSILLHVGWLGFLKI